MPVILAREHEQLWLDATTPAGVVAELLNPLPTERTAIEEVGTAVNDARYDGPDCLAPPDPTVQAALF